MVAPQAWNRRDMEIGKVKDDASIFEMANRNWLAERLERNNDFRVPPRNVRLSIGVDRLQQFCTAELNVMSENL